MADGKTKLCPICDSQIPADVQECPDCGTDLTLFDVSLEGDDFDLSDLDNIEGADVSLEDILKEVGGIDVSAELLKDIADLDLDLDLDSKTDTPKVEAQPKVQQQPEAVPVAPPVVAPETKPPESPKPVVPTPAVPDPTVPAAPKSEEPKSAPSPAPAPVPTPAAPKPEVLKPVPAAPESTKPELPPGVSEEDLKGMSFVERMRIMRGEADKESAPTAPVASPKPDDVPKPVPAAPATPGTAAAPKPPEPVPAKSAPVASPKPPEPVGSKPEPVGSKPEPVGSKSPEPAKSPKVAESKVSAPVSGPEDKKQPAKLEEKPPEQEVVAQFQCPLCNSMVDETSDSCPSCGALFVEEGEEAPAAQFQCPACNSMVDAEADSCPSCGALFVEEGEEVPAQDGPGALQSPAPTPIPATVPSSSKPEVAAATPTKPVPSTGSIPKKKKKKKKLSDPETGGAPTTPSVPASISTGSSIPESKPNVTAAEPVKPTVKPPVPAPISATPAPVPTSASPKPEVLKPIPAASAPVETSPKQSYQQLAELVEEVKPLLFEAKRIGLDVSKMKTLIAQAIGAGKKKDYGKAILLVKESRDSTEKAISNEINSLLGKLTEKRASINEPGFDASRIDQQISRAQDALSRKDYSNAYNAIRLTMGQLSGAVASLGSAAPAPVAVPKPAKPTAPAPVAAPKPAKPTAPAARPVAVPTPSPPASPAAEVQAENIQVLEKAIANAKFMDFDLKGMGGKLVQAQSLTKNGKVDDAKKLMIEIQQYIKTDIPPLMIAYISSAKPILIEAKMHGKDIAEPIGLVKEAKAAVDMNDYYKALEYIAAFKKGVK